MNDTPRSRIDPGDDWLDALLRTDGREHRAEYVDDGGFTARVMIDEKGNVSEVVIVSSEPPKVFDSVVIEALKEWKFKAEGEKYVGEVEINFKLQ